MPNKTDLCRELEKLLAKHPTGLTALELAKRVDVDLQDVRGTLSNMRTREVIGSTDPHKHSTRYYLITHDVVVAAPNTTSRMEGVYIPARDNPPMPGRPGMDDHMQFGSRMGQVIHFRDGTKKHISET